MTIAGVAGLAGRSVQSHRENGSALGRRATDVALPEHEDVECELGEQARADITGSR